MADHKRMQWAGMIPGVSICMLVTLIHGIQAGCVTDAQFVQDAILELRRSRHALMSSYAYGYYIERHMERELFEELQVRHFAVSAPAKKVPVM